MVARLCAPEAAWQGEDERRTAKVGMRKAKGGNRESEGEGKTKGENAEGVPLPHECRYARTKPA
jgi:hypothetical protein